MDLDQPVEHPDDDIESVYAFSKRGLLPRSQTDPCWHQFSKPKSCFCSGLSLLQWLAWTLDESNLFIYHICHYWNLRRFAAGWIWHRGVRVQQCAVSMGCVTGKVKRRAPDERSCNLIEKLTTDVSLCHYVIVTRCFIHWSQWMKILTYSLSFCQPSEIVDYNSDSSIN